MLKDNKHLQRIREMNCTLCDCPPNCDPHHITYAEKRGFGQKVVFPYPDELLVPLQTEFFALEGITQLVKTIDRIKKNLNPKLKVKGILEKEGETLHVIAGKLIDLTSSVAELTVHSRDFH